MSTCSNSVSSICNSRPASPLRLRGKTCAATALAWDSAMAAAGHHQHLRLLGRQTMLRAILTSCALECTGSRQRLLLQSTMSHHDHQKVSSASSMLTATPRAQRKAALASQIGQPAARAAPQTRAADVLASPSLILDPMAPASVPASSD